MIPTWLAEWPTGAAFANHVWQSTICAGMAGVLVLGFRKHHARVRYRVWLIASLKFLIPFSLLVGIGRHVPGPAVPTIATPSMSVTVQTIGEPFTEWKVEPIVPPAVSAAAPSSRHAIPFTLVVIWSSGAAFVLLSRWRRWRRLITVVGRAQCSPGGREVDALRRVQRTLDLRRRIALLVSDTSLEPGVVGIFRPVILWPAGLSSRLSDPELHGILAHELAHVRGHDNLAATFHLLVEAVFWFHPLVWWLGSRLVEERERACDEEVLRLGSEPRTYAESILKVCQYCLQSPLACVAGVTGSNLKRRVEEIMTPRIAQNLSLGTRLILTAIALAVLAGPIAVGALSASPNTDGPLVQARTPLATVSLHDAKTEMAVPLAMVTVPVRAGVNSPPHDAVADTFAQAATGGITGTVTDETGGMLPGATVTATSAAMGTAQSAVTDASGKFAIANVLPAQYEVRVAMPSFKTSTSRLQVNAGADVTANTQLELGGVTESVVVTTPQGRADAQPADEAQLLSRIAGNQRGASNYLDLAKIYYEQGRFSDAESTLTHALDLLRMQSTVQADVASTSVRVGGSIRAPRKIRDVRPIYPADAIAAHAAGSVILEARIAADGTVRDAKILRSIPLLDEAALGAVRQWLYSPTLLNGVPMEVHMTVTVNFAAP